MPSEDLDGCHRVIGLGYVGLPLLFRLPGATLLVATIFRKNEFGNLMME